ncbi:hypothetical protein [Cupriavidus nantongensis]|uniref:hypothetical protein n=1 Tax=Cupriavidus nantongensis TaxID=1796606 RepID=UPI0012378644|nr:hypothetical protein [Cupriavidus nantongensis]
MDAKQKSSHRQPIAAWLARFASVRAGLGYGYEASITMPTAGPSSPNVTQDFGTLPESGSFLDASKNGSKLRLRNVSLPEFFSATITHSEMGALLPAGVVLAGLGVSSEDVASVSVSVPAAASYGLPVWNAVASVKQSPPWNDPGFWPWATKYLYAYHSLSCSVDEQPVFVLVTEVFAAYALDVDFSFSKGGAARLQQSMRLPTDSTRHATLDLLLKLLSESGVDAPADSAKSGSTPKSGQIANSSASAAIPKKGSAGGTPVQRLRDQLDTLLASAAGQEQQQFPGITAQIVTGSDSGLKLQRKFAHPVVIGYRGVALLPEPDGKPPSEFVPLPIDAVGPFLLRPPKSAIPNPNLP